MDPALQPDPAVVPAIRTYAQPIATILVGFLAICGVLGGIFF